MLFNAKKGAYVSQSVCKWEGVESYHRYKERVICHSFLLVFDLNRKYNK